MRTKPQAWKIFFALAAVCALAAKFYQHVLKKSEHAQAAYAQKKILDLEGKIKASLETISTFTTDSEFHEFFIHSGQQEKGFSFFYFENGALRYWSDNEIVLPDNAISETIPSGTVLPLPNGRYEIFEKITGNKKLIGLILLHQHFSYENKYLVNHFNPILGLDQQFRLADGKGGYELVSGTGMPLLSLDYSHAIPDVLPFRAPAWFYLYAFLLLSAGILLFFQNRSGTFLSVAVMGLALLLLRYLMIYFRFPGELYYNDFFSPKVYGSSFFFNSIGDFFLNACSFLVFSGICYSHFNNNRYILQGTGKSAGFLAAAALLILLFSRIHVLIGNLVLNSKIVFDPSISDIDADTVAAALAVFLFLWGFFLLAAGALLPFSKLLRFNATEKLSTFRSRLFILLLIAAYTSIVVSAKLKERKMENQKLFAQRMDSQRDPLAEYLFQDLQKKIVNDTLVREIISSGSDVAGNVSQYLQQNFFTGYFTKFDVAVSIFDRSGISFDSSAAGSLSALREMFTGGKPTATGPLRLLTDDSGKLKYMSIFGLTGAAGDTEATLAILLSARSSQLKEGFPELLVSNSVIKNKDESSYSYARYSNGSLIFAGGSFPYAFHSTLFEKNASDYSGFSFDGYEHVVYRPSATSLVVVSRPAETFFGKLTLFSFVVLFFLAVFLAAYFLLYAMQGENRFRLSLKQRIRASIISLVVISFVLIAAGTSIYIVRKYDADKNKTILSRLNAMWFAITDHFTFDGKLSDSVRSQWTGELNNIVSNFNLDFNLYDESGNLFYSSQPKLFEKGILSTRINPEAFAEIQRYGKTQYVHAENIGTLSYAAAYAPFTDHSGNIAGYLNLPYFEKQNELNKEISGFLSALVNIYLLLLVVALVLALFITSRITKPLLLIQERLSLIKLGSRNEVIEWKRNDEIGQLVQQYNKMVEALAESAEKLTRSERESAWREMARQVAHEIKNPLTPMKLSVQHLQRAWNEKSGDLDALFRRISKTMIEQIDTLSNIASEFGNFAQMPHTRNEALRLKEILSSSINLFNDTPNVAIAFHDDGMERLVFADREQLIRAFSNLIKNAIQSVPENKKGLIEITLKTENDFHVVAVSDNGTGIHESLQAKIFTPNFTTKTSGMGLGLAMVKSTVDATGGIIWFETTEGNGSVFYVSIPAYEMS